jgi:PAS domain S-box-containing protein
VLRGWQFAGLFTSIAPLGAERTPAALDKYPQLSCEIFAVQGNCKRSVVVDFDEHHGSKLSGFHPADTFLAQAIGEIVHQRGSEVGLGSMNKAGPSALAAVSVERELGDDQGLSANIQDRKVGLALGVGKDPQIGDFVGQPVGFGPPIVVTRSDQNDETRADLACGLPVDRNLALTHALNDNSHKLQHSFACGYAPVILARVARKVKPCNMPFSNLLAHLVRIAYNSRDGSPKPYAFQCVADPIVIFDHAAHRLTNVREPKGVTMAESNRELEAEIAERRRVEEALRRERDLISSVMEISPAGITAVDLEGQISFANARAEQVLGLTRDEITQLAYNAPEWRITDYDGNPLPDDELPFRRVVATGKPVFDVRHAIEWPDGCRVLLSVNAVPLLNESGQMDGMVATVEDVTERVQAEQALRESEQRFRSIIERSPDGVMLTDEMGIIIEWNPGSEQITGLARDEVLGRFLWDVQVQMSREEQPSRGFLEQDKAMVLNLLETGHAEWASRLRDVEIARPDGTQRTIQTLVFVIQTALGYRVGSILRDVTETRRAGDEIRKLSRAIEQSPSTVVITDTEGKIEYANPKFSQVTGYMLEEILGETPRILKSGEQGPDFYESLWTTIVSGKEWRGEFSNRKKNGEIYWELASISPVRDANGLITHYVKVAEDITDRKRAEEALHQRTAELEVRNKELDAFAHTVAHDLQNPLGVMIGFAETLEEEPVLVPQEELKSHLHTIAQYGRKMSNIIDELLLLAGVRQMDVESAPLDMASIVMDARQRLADMIVGHGTEFIVSESWPAALGYGPWVEEVWVNYISNAIRYGGRPPRVELGAELLPGSPTAEEGARAEMVRFWVRDNGRGLTPEEQARLFVPFTQLAQVRVEGHGLGLSIVRRIMEKLGGQVGIESEGVPGKGCVFSFSLPAADDSNGQCSG